MSGATRRPRVFNIPAGVPFLETFVAAFVSGEIIPDFPKPGDPLELASATLFVPTRRSARALAAEMAKALDRPVVMLPKIVPLGQIDDIETGLLFADQDMSGPDVMVDTIGDIERRLALARLVQKWAQAIQHALVASDGAGQRQVATTEPLLVAKSPAQAWALAGDLAGLIDEMIIEDIPWSGLKRIVPEEFDRYWGLTLDFLNIAIAHWPEHLHERGLVDCAARNIDLVDAEIARLAATPRPAPVIAIGSTGTNKATARLLAALARAPMGAVVLPGLDKDLDDTAWRLILGDAARRVEPAAGHPQAALRRLLRTLDVERADVRDIGAPPAPRAARARFLSEALRPADTTDVWRGYATATPASDIKAALDDITIIEAADEREEALCLAIKMRETLQTPGRTAALITPDRDLARRARAELARWNIDVDDSGGEALGRSPRGAHARLVLTAAAVTAQPIDLLSVLAHPLTRLGRPRAEVDRLARLVEIGILRGVTPDNAAPAALIASARAAARDRNAHPAKARIGDDDWTRMEAMLIRLNEALAKLPRPGDRVAPSVWAIAHRDVLAAITTSDDSAESPDAEALARLFDELSGAPSAGFDLDREDYRSLFDQISGETIVRGPRRSHPRLKILGLLEARLLHADLVLLGGLDESVWPPLARADAFLNRPMRAQLGLSAPERRIGQTAHDFVQALGAPQVVISRARKRGGSPVVPSRFLQRMAALAGASAWDACRARGKATIRLARVIDARQNVQTRRPEPLPPIELRPTSLSVTRIETLRRDPYAIYAEMILRLQPLDPLGAEAGARETGILLHDLLSTFTRQTATVPARDPLATLLAMARETFKDFLANADFRAFQWPRVAKALGSFVEWEARRRDNVARLDVEQTGRLDMALTDGSTFALIGRADRIEQLRDGSIAIIDYKSGRVPTVKEINAGFAPQLVLEAAMIEKGAFPGFAAARVAEAVYVRIGGQKGSDQQIVGSKDKSLADLVTEQFTGLRALLDEFRDADTPYIPRPFPQFVNRFGVYDHLARVKEWSAGSSDGEAS